MDAVVAGSVLHAKAMIRWGGLDAKRFAPVAYGQELTERYGQALLVRPTSGISEADQEWIATKLLPQVDGGFGTHPPYWKPYHDTNQPLLEKPAEAPELEENPLWA